MFDSSALRNRAISKVRLPALMFAFALVVAALLVPSAAYATGDLTVVPQEGDAPIVCEWGDFESPDGMVSVGNITKGIVEYDTATATLKLNDVMASSFKVNGDVGTLTIEVTGYSDMGDFVSKKNSNVVTKLTGNGTLAVYHCSHYGVLVVEGGEFETKFNNCAFGTLQIKGGMLDIGPDTTCKSFLLQKGTAKVYDLTVSDSFTVKGGTFANGKRIAEKIVCKGHARISGGEVFVGRAYFSGGLNISGGTVKAKSGIDCAQDGGSKAADFTMTGGVVRAVDKKSSFWVTAKRFKMTDGSIIGPSKGNSSISASSILVRGGLLKNNSLYAKKSMTVAGGSLYCDTISVKGDKAMKCKAGCIKKVMAKLPVGAIFTVGGNDYKVVSGKYSVPNRSGWGFKGRRTYEYKGVMLIRYGSKSKEAVFKPKVKCGNVKYDLCGVGSNAFNTERGKQLTSIMFKGEPPVIEANAFAGTQSLVELTLQEDMCIYRGDGTEVRISSKISKKAFANCGKSKGRKLTLWLHYVKRVNGVSDSRYYLANWMSSYRACFEGHGLPKAVEITYYR